LLLHFYLFSPAIYTLHGPAMMMSGRNDHAAGGGCFTAHQDECNEYAIYTKLSTFTINIFIVNPKRFAVLRQILVFLLPG
jgi:hypothetical protein